jgi:hypothetical protein
MAAFTPTQWSAAKKVIDAFAQEGVDENGFSEQQWSVVRDIVDGRHTIQAVKDDSKVFFSPAQWSVVKDMVEGRSEIQNEVKEDSKVSLRCTAWAF